MTAWRFLFISLAAHLIIWLFLLHSPRFSTPEKDKSVEITVVDKNPPHKTVPKSIVRQALPPLDMLKPDPPKDPKYLSERDQNVKKEMKAQNSGLTQNGDSASARNGPKKQAAGKKSQDVKVPDQVGDLGPKKDISKYAPGPLDNSNVMSSNSTPSSNGEYLPELNNGPINALNTERFVYYSFFSRIEERIRPLWTRNVEDTHQRLPASMLRQLANHDWITGLEILVDPQGHYLETIVTQTSGVPEIDQAAIQAFQEAKYFPNPPKEMVQDDGKIHLKYAFVVQEGPQGLPFRAWR